MGKYFSSYSPSGPFILFSAPHIAAITAIALFCILLYIFRNNIKNEKTSRAIRYALGSVMVAQEISFQLWNILTNQWSIDYALPLQLCSISSLLCAAMLFTGSYRLYEIVYFWGIGGALQAVITPEIGPYTFPHFRYFQFFICHGGIIASCLFMTFIQCFRPKLASVWKSILALNIYAAFVGVFNKLTNSNYMFLCSKPEVSSIMDIMGPWPWYILSLEGVALFIFLCLYIPFIRFGKTKTARKEHYTAQKTQRLPF